MIFKLVEALDKRFGFERAKAHCDIPCGIYDPITAQIAALIAQLETILKDKFDLRKYFN